MNPIRDIMKYLIDHGLNLPLKGEYETLYFHQQKHFLYRTFIISRDTLMTINVHATGLQPVFLGTGLSMGIIRTKKQHSISSLAQSSFFFFLLSDKLRQATKENPIVFTIAKLLSCTSFFLKYEDTGNKTHISVRAEAFLRSAYLRATLHHYTRYSHV